MKGFPVKYIAENLVRLTNPNAAMHWQGNLNDSGDELNANATVFDSKNKRRSAPAQSAEHESRQLNIWSPSF